MSDLKKVDIFTDGACSGNPGPGGYGVIVKDGNKEKELSGGYRKTTNNRMEIMAAIVGLESLKAKSSVTVYSDSSYLVNAISEGWAKRWRENGWMRNKKEKAVNPDLWARLLKLLEKHEVTFSWVKGHSSHPENQRCDKLAVQASRQSGLHVDEGYESSVPQRLL